MTVTFVICVVQIRELRLPESMYCLCGVCGLQVLRQLNKHYTDHRYTERNVILSGTHTHSTPGGFLMHVLFDISSWGFVEETFEALVEGIVLVSNSHQLLSFSLLTISLYQTRRAGRPSPRPSYYSEFWTWSPTNLSLAQHKCSMARV